MILKNFLLLSLLFLTTSCTSFKNSYELLSFREDPNSGVLNQEIGLNFIYEYNSIDAASIEGLFDQVGDVIPGIHSYKKRCTNDVGRIGASSASLAAVALPAIITFIANETYSFVQSSISTYAEELANRSVAEKIIKVPFHGEKVKDWKKVNCIAITRYDVETKKIGMFILLQKQALTESYILTPRLIYFKNSPAITEIGSNDKPAKVKIDIGFALHAILYDKATSKYNSVEISSLVVPVGSMEFGETKSISCQTKNAGPYCKEASSLIADIPEKAKTIEVAFKIVETGSATNAKSLAESTNKALDGIVKPVFDQLVSQVSSKLGQ